MAIQIYCKRLNFCEDLIFPNFTDLRKIGPANNSGNICQHYESYI
ncbi:MAG: hypothetical protein PV344_05555 [Anaplasma sp.]|nr:hypothetical protein [Anaplasma sp.]